MKLVTNAHEEAARVRKVQRLADWLWFREGYDSLERIEHLPRMPRQWWEELAARAGVNPPGEDGETIHHVVVLLRKRVPTPDQIEAAFARFDTP